MTEHPLASLTGITALLNMVRADQVWSSCTKPQQALLAELCPPVMANADEGSIPEEVLPVLPFAVPDRTREALRRRGLIDHRDRLTTRAVHAWFYAGRLKESGGDAS
jgi:hypothetical protein